MQGCTGYPVEPDIRLNRISSQDLGIRFNRISGIRYITVSVRISIPVLSGTIIIGFIYLILDHLKCVRSLKKSSSDVNFIKKFFLVESQTHPQSMTDIKHAQQHLSGTIQYPVLSGIRWQLISGIIRNPVKFDIWYPVKKWIRYIPKKMYAGNVQVFGDWMSFLNINQLGYIPEGLGQQSGFSIGCGVAGWKSFFHFVPIQQAGACAARNGQALRRL